MSIDPNVSLRVFHQTLKSRLQSQLCRINRFQTDIKRVYQDQLLEDLCLTFKNTCVHSFSEFVEHVRRYSFKIKQESFTESEFQGMLDELRELINRGVKALKQIKHNICDERWFYDSTNTMKQYLDAMHDSLDGCDTRIISKSHCTFKFAQDFNNKDELIVAAIVVEEPITAQVMHLK